MPISLLALSVTVACILPRIAGGQTVSMRFDASDPTHEEALAEYRDIWRVDGARILHALETRSGMTFPVTAITVGLINGPSWAGADRIGMRATYPTDTKRATLTHELGHILVGDIPLDPDGQPIVGYHVVLFLFLYDVWVDLWGEDFGVAQVGVESARRGGGVDYERRWNEALALTAEERAAELARVRTLIRPPQ